MAASTGASKEPLMLDVRPSGDAGETEKRIKEGVTVLEQGQVVAVPTDTIYGVACLAQCTEAIARIYEIKGRDASKPVAICVPAVSDIKDFGQVTVSDELLAQLLPGPVTVVFERTARLNTSLNPDTQLVGIRVPDHPFIQSLVRHCGQPLALTSANKSGEPSTVSVEEFSKLWPLLGAVFDGGVIEQPVDETARAGSTVVDLSKSGTFRIIRAGSARQDTTEKLTAAGLVERQE